jgi:hypothetical protein
MTKDDTAAISPVGIRAFHGSPKSFDAFQFVDEPAWFSTNKTSAENFGRDRTQGVTNPRFGGNARSWRDAKPYVYEADINPDKLQKIYPISEARKIAKEIGAPIPKTWDDVSELLQWGNAQKMWIDEARSAGKSGVLFKNVSDDPMGIKSDHIAVIDHNILSLLRRYGLLGAIGGGAAAAGGKQAPTEEQTDYAQGGSVDSVPVYDPAVIAAIAASITEDNYA